MMLIDIVNSGFNLGKQFLEMKIVRKVFRSLLKRFRPQITIIEESKDLYIVKIKELVGSLITYKLTISKSKKDKSAALNTIREKQYNTSEDDTFNDEERTYFNKKLKITFGNNKKPKNKYEEGHSTFRKDYQKKKSQSV